MRMRDRGGRNLCDFDFLTGWPVRSASGRIVREERERDGDASPASPADAADPVHVLVGIGRQVEVDDVRKVSDIEAAGGDVGRDEQVGGTDRKRPMT